MESEKVELRRQIGLAQGVSVIVSSMIGSGIFITPGSVLKSCGSIPVAILVWIISGVLVTFGSMMYIELGGMMPTSGGDYEYLLQTMGSAMAFLFTWTRIVLSAPSSLAAAALAFGNYLLLPIFPCGIPTAPRYMLGVVALMIFTYLNSKSVAFASRLQILFALGKAIALVMVIGAGLYAFSTGGARYYEKGFSGTSSNALDIMISFYSAIFAYTGWNFLNYVVEEMKEPEKNLPRCIFIGLSVVTVLYVMANLAYFAMIPIETAISTPAIAVTAMAEIYPPLGTIISILVSLSVFGYLNSAIFTMTRVGFSAARNRHMPVVMAFVTVNFRTPMVSVIVLALLTLIYISIGNLESIVYMNSFSETIFYCVTSIAYFWLRWKKPDAKRTYKAPIVFPIIFFVAMAFITLLSLIREPDACAGALGLILSGMIFYFVFYIMIKPQKIRKISDEFIVLIQKLSYSTFQGA